MINIKQFYFIASILMIISVLGQIWNLKLTWEMITIGAKISSITGGVLFSCLLTVLFIGLWRATPNMNQVIDNKEMDKFLEQIKNEAK